MKLILGALIVIFQNACPDYTNDWTCLNYTQAAQSFETIQQIKLARKKTGFKRKMTIVSIDPIRRGKNPEKDMTWEYGAWERKGKIYFAAMSGCPNARVQLERLFRRLR